MHTKDKLAQALKEANLPEMAKKAEEGMYHDFLSPDPLASLTLATELDKAASEGNEKARELLKQHMNGEFDASLEESDEWAKGKEGIAALAELIKNIPKPRFSEQEYYHKIMKDFDATVNNAATLDEFLIFLDALSGAIKSTASFLFHNGMLNEDQIRESMDQMKSEALDLCLAQEHKDRYTKIRNKNNTVH